MSNHTIIPACVLCCLLFFVVTGCDQPGHVTPPETSESSEPQPLQPPPETDDLDKVIEQLLRKRLDAQEKIEEAMKLCRATGDEVEKQREELRKNLGDKPVAETVELFSKSKRSEIPPDLLPAYSCWQTLLPDETLRLKIIAWIDLQQTRGLLEEMDIKIKVLDNYRKLSLILDQTDLREVDRLLAVSLSDWNSTDDANNAIYEQEAINQLKTELTNLE